MDFKAPYLNLKGLFNYKSPLYYNYLIYIPFNITYFIINGGYYYSLFKFIIKLII